MNGKQAKAFRKLAKKNVVNQDTTYIQGIKYANGQEYSVATTVQLDPSCARGFYQALKKTN